jgi:hypothetical protein
MPTQSELDRRVEPRARTLLAGKLIIGMGASFLSPGCTIIDLSEHGARVRIAGCVRLPPPVALLMTREGVLVDAAVAWRREDEAGLALRERYDLRHDVDPLHRHVRALWAQLAH